MSENGVTLFGYKTCSIRGERKEAISAWGLTLFKQATNAYIDLLKADGIFYLCLG